MNLTKIFDIRTVQFKTLAVENYDGLMPKMYLADKTFMDWVFLHSEGLKLWRLINVECCSKTLYLFSFMHVKVTNYSTAQMKRRTHATTLCSFLDNSTVYTLVLMYTIRVRVEWKITRKEHY